MRFDLFAALLSGSDTILDREWYDVYHEYHVQQVKSKPNSLGWKLREITANYRLVSCDVANLFARQNEESGNCEDFMEKTASLSRQLDKLEEEMDPSLRDAAYVITSAMTETRLGQETEFFDFDGDCHLYGGPLSATNLILLDGMGMKLRLYYQLTTATKMESGQDFTNLAFRTCCLAEAIEKCPQNPPGSIFTAQSSLTMAILCLSIEQRHMTPLSVALSQIQYSKRYSADWCRQKLAVIEASG